MEKIPETEKLIPQKPHLRYIEKTLSLLESDIGPDGEEINWKDLYEKVGPWETGLELSEKIREVVRDYLISKLPTLKEKIPSIADLPDVEMLNALANGWFEELEEVEGTRKQVLLGVLAHITKRIETRIYKKILKEANEEQLSKLGLKENMRELILNTLDAAVKSDPMFIRFLAYSHLSKEPPEGVEPSTPIGTDGLPHTWAELFPHEAQYIASKLNLLLKEKSEWIQEKGAKEFAEYLEILAKYFFEKDINESDRLRKEMEIAYAKSIEADFPIQIAPPTGSYYKEPYVDPELRVLIHTPDAEEQEVGFKKLQESLASELNKLNVDQFADTTRNMSARSYLSVSAYGASLTYTAAAEMDKSVTLFLDEQIRHWDKNLERFLPLIQFETDPFADTPPEKIREMSRSDTMLHEFSHPVYYSDTEEAERLGATQETIIAETSAETIHRGLALEILANGGLDYTREQYIAITICMPLQELKKNNDDKDSYYKAAIYVLNGMFERGIVEFDGSKIKINDKDAVFSHLKDNAKKIISLYENPEMDPQKAKKWIKDNCTAGEKLQKLIDFIKNKN